MKSFSQLTQRGQHRRLKTLGQTALRHYGLTGAKLTFIADSGNTVFRVDDPTGSYALRIHPPGRSMAAIADELTWLAALRRETPLVVPTPLATVDGALVQTIATPGIPEGRQVVLFCWVPGQIVGANYDAALIERLGALMAQLHNHADTFRLPAANERDRTDWVGMGDWYAHVPQAQAILTPAEQALCAEAARQVAGVIAQVDLNQNFGLIHSDLHFHNCVNDHGQLGILDFDDCQFAPYSYDLAITLTYFDDVPDALRLRQAFLNGYQQARPLPDHTAVIDAFMVERGLRIIRWVLHWPTIDHLSAGRARIARALARCQRYLAQYPSKSSFSSCNGSESPSRPELSIIEP